MELRLHPCIIPLLLLSLKPNSDTDSGPVRHSDLSDSIFRTYLEFTGKSTSTTADLSKIQSFLTSSSSGALSCLLCLEQIRPADPTWSCTSVGFSVFHLICIQSSSTSSTLHSRPPWSRMLPLQLPSPPAPVADRRQFQVPDLSARPRPPLRS
ncbi:hypothetical protein FF1_018073 [Malus domestica]